MKKIASIIMALALLVAFSSTALASPPANYSVVPTIGTPAVNGVGSASWQAPQTMMAALTAIQLTTCHNSITEVSSGYVKCYAYSLANQLSDKIENNYVLQKWNGSSWAAYSTSSNAIYTATSYTSNIYRYVDNGYYYRIETTHRAWLDSIYDQEVLDSSYIYVS